MDDVQNDEHWFGLILWQGNNPFRLGIQGLGFRETSIQHLLPDGGSTFHGLGADNIVLFLWADLQTKVAAAAKGAATRVARGTMSKKQRLAITAVPEPTVSVAGVAGASAAAAPTAAEPTAGTAPAASSSPNPSFSSSRTAAT